MLNRQPINILISCVGRQSFLVRQFQAALPRGSRVVATDSDPLSVGAASANTSYMAPVIDSPGYTDWVISLCVKEAITLIVSLLPEDLLRLEQIRPELKDAGIKLVGMEPHKIRQCLNKSTYEKLCKGTGFHPPPRFCTKSIETIPPSAYPLIAKETYGKGSIGLCKLNSKAETQAFFFDLRKKKRDNSYILQSFLNGQEYGLDLVNDLQGRYVATFVRRKLRMRNGETDVAETVSDFELESAGRALAIKLKHQGLIDCDVIRCGQFLYLLDVNPRFGGGYIFSHEASANIPAALVAWLFGQEPAPAWLSPQPQITAARTSCLERISQPVQRIAVITSANAEIGMGHANRQLAIVATAHRAGLFATLITDSELVSAHATEKSIDVIQHPLDDRIKIQSILESLQPACLIIDVHERDFPSFRWLAEHWNTLLVVSRVGHGFDLYGKNVILLGEDLDCWKAERRFFSGKKKTHVYSGRAFVPFRDEFNEKTFVAAGQREPLILIAHGGADPHHLTQRCLRAMELTQGRYRVKVLVGPAFDDRPLIVELAGQSKHCCDVIVGESHVSHYMSEASIALINGGNVRYELCITGTPFVALSFQQRQYECTEQITKMGLGVNLGVASKVNDSQIAIAVDRLMKDRDDREKMGREMRMLFDTRGSERIIQIAKTSYSEVPFGFS